MCSVHRPRHLAAGVVQNIVMSKRLRRCPALPVRGCTLQKRARAHSGSAEILTPAPCFPVVSLCRPLPTAADRTTRAPCLLPSKRNLLFVCKHSTPAMPAERLDVSEHRKARNRSRSPLVADPGLSSQNLEHTSATNNNQNQNTVSGLANIVNSNPNFVIQSSSSAVVNYNSVSNFTTTGSVPEAFVSVSHDMILQYKLTRTHAGCSSCKYCCR